MSNSVSVVTTLFHSEAFIEEFYRRIKAVLGQHELDHEIIFVNDGSPDHSLATACLVAREDPKVTVVDLSRNYGHHKAMMTGLSYARKGFVFLIDVDLEEAPELFSEYWREIQEHPECDVIYGIQETRKGKLFERVTGEIFYFLFNWLSPDKITRNMALSRLMTSRYVNHLVRFRERNLFIPGIWHLMGFEQRGVIIKKYSRKGSSYTLRKRIGHLVDAVTSFSQTPLNLIFYTGIAVCAGSFGLALFFIILKLAYGVSVSGWTSLMVVFSSLSGVVILFLGIIGIYLSKMFIELKQRPYTIVKATFPDDSAPVDMGETHVKTQY